MASSISCLECHNWIEDVKVSGYWICEKCWEDGITNKEIRELRKMPYALKDNKMSVDMDCFLDLLDGLDERDREIEKLRDVLKVVDEQWQHAQIRNDRYEKALEAIANEKQVYSLPLWWATKIARQALGGENNEDN